MPRQFSLAIVGADHMNKRGPTRRFEIAMCNPGEPVQLVPEPKNPVDPLAIAVMSCRGIQIGYVRAERAQLMRTAMSRGEVTAIFQRAETWGATIRVGFNGVQPTLPEPSDSRADDWPPVGSEDADWWPDERYDED
jgi:hypothetical protein